MSASGSSVNILGGIPTHKDLAPSSVFIALYILLVPVYLWRITSKRSWSTALIRPGIFIVSRIVAMVLRVIQATGNTSEGLFIAELVILTVGFVFLVDPLVCALNSHIAPIAQAARPNDSAKKEKHWLERMSTLLHIMLLVVIISGIIIGTKISDAINDPTSGAATTVTHMRLAAYILSITVLAVIIAATVLVQIQFSAYLEARRSAFIVTVAVIVLVPSIYKLAQSEITDPTSWIHSMAAFFLLLLTFEFLGICIILAIPWAEWFPTEKQREDRDRRDDDSTEPGYKNELLQRV